MKPFLLAAALLCAALSAVAAEWVAADVVAIDAARGKVTLKHAAIKHIDMAAMTMPFEVADRAALQPLKVGDKVRFQVVQKDGSLVVNAIERRR